MKYKLDSSNTIEVCNTLTEKELSIYNQAYELHNELLQLHTNLLKNSKNLDKDICEIINDKFLDLLD